MIRISQEGKLLNCGQLLLKNCNDWITQALIASALAWNQEPYDRLSFLLLSLLNVLCLDH